MSSRATAPPISIDEVERMAREEEPRRVVFDQVDPAVVVKDVAELASSFTVVHFCF